MTIAYSKAICATESVVVNKSFNHCKDSIACISEKRLQRYKEIAQYPKVCATIFHKYENIIKFFGI